ncbi:MAG: amidohydrolase [Acidobacteria bacterium]|nr:amidohydrolase [Acidobacteriota bacterium]
MTDQRQVIISCDGHATGRPDDYVPYIDPAYRERYEEFATGLKAERAATRKARREGDSLFTDEGSFGLDEETGDDRDGEWNSSIRTRVLEGEGVVGEVLFPNGGVPFGGFGESAEFELRAAGNRAYDRWLVDFANDSPGRRAALAMLTVHDLDETVKEIAWAAANGMKGVIIPTVPGEGLPPYLDQCYDPMWAACQEHAMPVHIHGGGGTPDYGDYGIVSMLMYATEATFFSQRNLWILIWAGVLDRFPDMQVVFTETRASWVPDTLMLLDGIHRAPFFQGIDNTAKLKPSEYFERQVTIAASFMSSYDAALRDDIGVSRLMWGADYPHPEGTWPRTRKSLARCFEGIPETDVRAILAENPARVYGFDIEALQPIADEVGPTMGELVGSSAA